MSAAELTISLATVEVVHLTELIDQLLTVIERPESTSDPAVRRLTPHAYPDDEEASAEFAAATREELIDRRRTDAQVVQTALAQASATVHGDADHDTREHEVRVSLSALESWMRTLTTLRLVIATRLNIDTDDDHDPDSPRFGVYDWLGYRLDRLVELADAHDAGQH